MENNRSGNQKVLKKINDLEKDLSRIENINFLFKSEEGSTPTDYLRRNLFHATSTIDKTKGFENANFKRVLFENEKYSVSVNRYLHQRHKDVLTVLFTNNLKVTAPLADGKYSIHVNLTDVARSMGYKTPRSSTWRVRELIDDLRSTDILITKKKPNGNYTKGHKFLGNFQLDEKSKHYIIDIPAETARYHIVEYGVEIPLHTIKKILAIPYTLSKLKALITFMLSNKKHRNGLGIASVMESLAINTRKTRYAFKKEVNDNINVLNDFKIDYDKESEKFSLLEEMSFERGIGEKEIREALIAEGKIKPISDDEDGSDSLFGNVRDLTYLKTKWLNKYLRIAEANFLIKGFKYENKEKNQIIIETTFNNAKKNISSHTANIDELEGKITKYNMNYLDFKDDCTPKNINLNF